MIEQENSKPRNNNRWIQNVCIERILYIYDEKETNKQFMNVQIGNGTERRR